MPPELKSQGSRAGKTASRDPPLETTGRTIDGEPKAFLPVVTLASLDMSHQLRAMLKSAQSPDVLPRLYLDLRERLDQVSSSIPDPETLNTRIRPLSLQATGAQESALGLKTQLEDLREVVYELSKSTSQEASSHDADLLSLRVRVQEISEALPNLDSVNVKISSLTTRLLDTQEQAKRASAHVQELREMVNSLSAENTLLRGRYRDIESVQQVWNTKYPWRHPPHAAKNALKIRQKRSPWIPELDIRTLLNPP